jgi:acyl-CoA dehydrogenase
MAASRTPMPYAQRSQQGCQLDVLGVPQPAFMQHEEIVLFADTVEKFYQRHATPELCEKWRAQGQVDRQLWEQAAKDGLLCASMPVEYGGGGGDFRHETILSMAAIRRGVDGFAIALHNNIVAPYILAYGTEEQKRRWLPRLANGELIAAIAMTEPGTGSDLAAVKTTARRDGDEYVINGSKTFISNGQLANLICVVTKTDPAAGSRGISLVMVETDEAAGFRRGRNLDKVGCEAQDTSELFFEDVRVPASNLLGLVEGKGFRQLSAELAKERLTIALQAVAAMERALEETIPYVKQREVFGQHLIEFQNTQFKLAECKTMAVIAKVFCDYCMGLLLDGKLDANMAAMAKYWATEAQGRVVDECVQLFGGYGYMNEYPIARLYRDARISRILGGTNEIMKMLIARSL